ncbi:hypothetical protein [Streptomyces fuscigenes]|uniref:hypothetical protein n=1 Tax=Streptomyces fuscigenes TaxID=1528880 RepID=UPI001F3DF58B|nr:hypothetical protein [Streptomyces fuscigenes]MCF3960506.1 hypothetical protein [Streptomyces fuscigenes]
MLGIAGGTAVGYGVQARRPPVPVGTLAQAGLTASGRSAGPAVPLPVAEDAGVPTAGDLRKVLVPVPKGARAHRVAPDVDGWLSLDGYASLYDASGNVQSTLSKYHFRRAVDEHWTQGRRAVDVVLIQVQPGTDQYAAEIVDDLNGGRDSWAGSVPVAGSTNGFFIRSDIPADPGHPDLHHVAVVESRGDTVAEMHLYDPKTISTADVQALATEQMERL